MRPLSTTFCCLVLAGSVIMLTGASALAQNEGLSERDIGASAPAPAAVEQPSGAEATPATAPKTPKYFPYTIRPGDSLGSIAENFGVSAEDLAKLNRIQQADDVKAGDTLKIPNPFEAAQKNLEAQIDQLSTQARDDEDKLHQAQSQVVSLGGKNSDLTADNATLRESVKAMPWWRATALGMSGAALLLFGVTALTLFEWWRVRRRMMALRDFSLSLSRLDVKYKEMLAKAELRMQQLYGRRRPAGASEALQHSVKTADEIEVERLSHELREMLEFHLDRLGVRGGNERRSRWREILGAEKEPEPRTVRR